MYQKKANAIQRARISRGFTQEALAECSGYSADSIRAWESGVRTASMEALGILSECLQSPWLAGVYLREQSDALTSLIPDFRVGRPIPEAAAAYISCVMELIDERFDRQLLRMVADGQIDCLETQDYEKLIRLGGQATAAYYELRFAEGGIEYADHRNHDPK